MQNWLGYFDEREFKEIILKCRIKLIVEEWLYVPQSAGAQIG